MKDTGDIDRQALMTLKADTAIRLLALRPQSANRGALLSDFQKAYAVVSKTLDEEIRSPEAGDSPPS